MEIKAEIRTLQTKNSTQKQALFLKIMFLSYFDSSELSTMCLVSIYATLRLNNFCTSHRITTNIGTIIDWCTKNKL